MRGEAQFGPYSVLERLDVGGMAEIFLAERRDVGGFVKRVAIKKLLPRYARDPHTVALFLDEAALAARLSHPSIVQVYAVEQCDGEYFQAMEYLEGATLEAIVMRFDSVDRVIPPALVAAIGATVADALHYLHTLTDEAGRPLGAIHRDIKPSNIFVTKLGHIKLIDFGIARSRQRVATTETGVTRGTMRFMAPEQRDGEALDHRVDIYALGATLFDTLNRGPGRSFLAVPDDFTSSEGVAPPGLAAILDRAVAQNIHERYATAAELHHDLMTWLTQHGEAPSAQDLTGLLHPEVQGSGPVGATGPSSPAGPSAALPEKRLLPTRRVLSTSIGLFALGGALLWALLLPTHVPPPPHPSLELSEIPATSPPEVTPRAPEVEPRSLARSPEVENQSLEAKSRLIELPPIPMPKPRQSKPIADVESAYQSAVNALLRGQFGDAAKRFQEVLAQEPQRIEAHRGLGYAYAELGRTAAARRHLEHYLRRVPQAPDAPAVRSRLAALAGRSTRER